MLAFPELENPPKYYSHRQVAELSGLTEGYVKKCCSKGKVPKALADEGFKGCVKHKGWVKSEE